MADWAEKTQHQDAKARRHKEGFVAGGVREVKNEKPHHGIIISSPFLRCGIMAGGDKKCWLMGWEKLWGLGFGPKRQSEGMKLPKGWNIPVMRCCSCRGGRRQAHQGAEIAPSD